MGLVKHTFGFVTPPPFLRIEIPHGMIVGVLPALTIILNDSNVSYTLTAMIFLRDAHYWCELIVGGVVIAYDGRQCTGCPQIKGAVDTVYGVENGILQLPDTVQPCMYVYVDASV